MIKVRKTVELPLKMIDLYDYLLQPVNITDYVGPIRKIRPAEPATVSVGTRLYVDVAFLGIHFTEEAECTVHRPPERFECRSVGGRFAFEAGFTLHPTTLGTRLDGWGDASAPSLFRLAEPVVQFFIERQVDHDFTRLRQTLSAVQDQRRYISPRK